MAPPRTVSKVQVALDSAVKFVGKNDLALAWTRLRGVFDSPALQTLDQPSQCRVLRFAGMFANTHSKHMSVVDALSMASQCPDTTADDPSLFAARAARIEPALRSAGSRATIRERSAWSQSSLMRCIRRATAPASSRSPKPPLPRSAPSPRRPTTTSHFPWIMERRADALTLLGRIDKAVEQLEAAVDGSKGLSDYGRMQLMGVWHWVFLRQEKDSDAADAYRYLTASRPVRGHAQGQAKAVVARGRARG